MNQMVIGFIGFGLIGGSIAKATKLMKRETHIIAYNNKDGINPSLEAAKYDGIVDYISKDLTLDYASCDIIFLCAPVLENISYLKVLKSVIKPGCIITDVGSVKGNIHESITMLGMEDVFIGGHPMAGSEKTGYENSHPTLVENAYYVLTPTKKTTQSQLNFLTAFVEGIHAIPVILNPQDHDDVVAAISHIPHIIASSLVNFVRAHDTSEEEMKQLAAGGFRDLTRIASSSPIMWQNICLTNTESICNGLRVFIKELSAMIASMEGKEEDQLISFFESAKEYRDSIPRKNVGLIHRIYEVYLDVSDETGAIATIATILANHGISIKNIGIIHNREFQDGVLRIELYEEDGVVKTVDLLKQYHYTIYEH